MKTLTRQEVEDLKDDGALFLTKPAKKPKPVPEAQPPLPDRTDEVIKAAGEVISAAEARMQLDTVLADKIAEAINAKTGPVSYRCTIKRGKEQRNGAPGPVLYVDVDPKAKRFS